MEFNEIVENISELEKTISGIKNDNIEVITKLNDLSEELKMYHNLAKGYENKSISYRGKTYSSKWIETKRFDSTGFKKDNPETYTEYMKVGISKKLYIKEI